MKRELFKLNHGPWKKLFEGEIQEMPVELYTNPAKYILVVIYDLGKKKVNGAVVQLHHPFLAKGSLEMLIETIPKNCLVLEKRELGETVKWLLISSPTHYLRWKETSFQKEFDQVFKEMKTYAKTVKEHARGFEVRLNPLKDCSHELQSVFFNEPIVIPGLVT